MLGTSASQDFELWIDNSDYSYCITEGLVICFHVHSILIVKQQRNNSIELTARHQKIIVKITLTYGLVT